MGGTAWREGDDVHVDLLYGTTEGGWLDGAPAMMARIVGKGAISHLGTLLDEATMQRVLAAVEGEAGLPDARFDLPEGVEMCVQRKPGQRGNGSEVLILINHNEASQTIKLPGRFRSIITDKSGLTSLELPAQGVEVLTEEGIR